MPNSKMENVDIGDLELIWTSKKGKTREVKDYRLYSNLLGWVGQKAGDFCNTQDRPLSED